MESELVRHASLSVLVALRRFLLKRDVKQVLAEQANTSRDLRISDFIAFIFQMQNLSQRGCRKRVRDTKDKSRKTVKEGEIADIHFLAGR